MEYNIQELSEISLTVSNKPPKNPIAGQMYYNSAYSVMQMFLHNRWETVDASGSVLGLMSREDKDRILKNKDFFSGKIFVILNPLLQTGQDTYAKDEHVLELIGDLGVEILWYNQLVPYVGLLRCIIVRDMDDVNLIRLAYNNLVSKIMDSCQVIEDIQV